MPSAKSAKVRRNWQSASNRCGFLELGKVVPAIQEESHSQIHTSACKRLDKLPKSLGKLPKGDGVVVLNYSGNFRVNDYVGFSTTV
jgi:hypothetical protein